MDVTAQQFLHLRHVQGSGECGFLAVVNFRFQYCRGHGIADAKVVVQILFIALANVQFPAEAGKSRDGHLFQYLRQCIELPGSRGGRDVSRGGLEGVCFGFGAFKIVQCGIQQGHRPGARSAGFQPKPWDVSRDVKAKERFTSVQFQAESGLERRFEKWFGEVGGALQLCHHLINLVLAGHMTGNEFAQFCMLMGWSVLEPGRNAWRAVAQCLTPLRRCLAEPGGDHVAQVLIVSVWPEGVASNVGMLGIHAVKVTIEVG
ncbi:hypothetical protein D3C87_1181130 [compost metagenome]